MEVKEDYGGLIEGLQEQIEGLQSQIDTITRKAADLGSVVDEYDERIASLTRTAADLQATVEWQTIAIIALIAVVVLGFGVIAVRAVVRRGR